MPPYAIPFVTITLPRPAITGFASLLQHGILYPVDRPVEIQPFLLSLPGFSADYIEKAVQTIFINGVAADSLDRCLSCGGTLALSAAMPGLAGAIFRRQGLHGCLRSQPPAKDDSTLPCSGYITLKLFNSVATDRVFDLMSQGILVEEKAFHDFVIRRESLFQPPVRLSLADQSLHYAGLLPAIAQFPVLEVQTRVLSES